MLADRILESIPRAIRALRLATLSVLDGPLTFHQIRVLYLIEENLNQSQIAEYIQVSPAAVCKLMHQLDEKGYIRMVPGKDRRERSLSLTAEGTRSLRTVSRHLEKKLNKILGPMTDRERDDLLRGLDALDKLTERLKEG